MNILKSFQIKTSTSLNFLINEDQKLIFNKTKINELHRKKRINGKSFKAEHSSQKAPNPRTK